MFKTIKGGPDLYKIMDQHVANPIYTPKHCYFLANWQD